MKPFEDSIPEEQGEMQEALTALLRRAYRQESFAESVQRETIRRVGERLANLGESDSLLSEQQLRRTESAFFPQSQHKVYQYRPLRRVMNTIAVVLVVSILIGSTVLLLAQKMRAPARHPVLSKLASPISATDSVDVKWDGLEMSMHVTPGPYFLGELLAVDLSLTNHTHSPLILSGKNDGSETPLSPCSSYSLHPMLTGGTSPYYSLYTKTIHFVYACGVMGDGPAFIPGQTITDHFYTLLTSSGEITLTGVAFFAASSPLTGHLPALHIQVASQVPTDHMLSLQQQGSEVLVRAPTGLRLVGQTDILCQVSSTDRGTPAGYNYWQPLTTHTLQRPTCPDINGWANGQPVNTHWTAILWKYAIGAAGYEVAQGQSTDAA